MEFPSPSGDGNNSRSDIFHNLCMPGGSEGNWMLYIISVRNKNIFSLLIWCLNLNSVPCKEMHEFEQ